MRKPLLAALSLVMFVSACGSFQDSRLNPFNWFGGAEPAAPALPAAKPADPRPLAARIIELKVEPMPGGAIVRATALPPTQGYWDAELVALDLGEDGVQIYEFRLIPPIEPLPAATPRSRQVTAAAYLSSVALGPIRAITVQGAENGLSSRR
ncbi:hypothetical protein SAMN04488103_102514 [Gemmobacter aquatilis]|uniref:Lipoprotein n=1 Tax=Gemmobacter aquatilis TaxID=933059 RepID=A0A1H8CIX3_9RHOB|nr:hypothetical protein [Gemmobacter aquatilis]SEM94374.1 hypothetical protein SAMN04488103_102514 [Gemmobacter aquatilis]